MSASRGAAYPFRANSPLRSIGADCAGFGTSSSSNDHPSIRKFVSRWGKYGTSTADAAYIGAMRAQLDHGSIGTPPSDGRRDDIWAWNRSFCPTAQGNHECIRLVQRGHGTYFVVDQTGAIAQEQVRSTGKGASPRFCRNRAPRFLDR